MEMTLSMMLSAHDQGVFGIFPTPHSSAFNSSFRQIQAAFCSLHAKVGRYFPGVPIYPGYEACCDFSPTECTPDNLAPREVSNHKRHSL